MHSHTHIHTHKSVMWSFWNISNYYSLTIFWWILRESVVLYPAPMETRTALPEAGKWPQRGGSWCWWEKQVWLVYRPASRPSMEEHANGSCSLGNGGEEKGQADTDTGTFPEETARHLRSHWKGQCFTKSGKPAPNCSAIESNGKKTYWGPEVRGYSLSGLPLKCHIDFPSCPAGHK